jgi:DNA adenine methylase
MKPFFSRIGGKRFFSEKLVGFIPEHEIYIEPFVGGGAVFFRKEPSKKEIINDKDKGLIEGYRLIKKASTNMDKYNFQYSIDDMNKFMYSDQKSPENKLLQRIYIHRNTYGGKGTGKVYPGKGKRVLDSRDKILKLDEYQTRLKKTIILNQDYKTVIKKYDSKDAFIYLDPPYENSGDLYGDNSDIDYQELLNILKNVKGKFLLSLNDSKRIKDIFQEFNIYKIKKVKSSDFLGGAERKELLISNYKI